MVVSRLTHIFYTILIFIFDLRNNLGCIVSYLINRSKWHQRYFLFSFSYMVFWFSCCLHDFSKKYFPNCCIVVFQCLLGCYLSFLDLGVACFLLFSFSKVSQLVLQVLFLAYLEACFQNSLLTGLYMRKRCLSNCSYLRCEKKSLCSWKQTTD